MGETAQFTPFYLTELDRQLLAMSDEEFVAHDWDNLRDIIGESESPLTPLLLSSSCILFSPHDSPILFIPI